MGTRRAARLYRWWLRVAARIQTVVVTILFGACYLLVVPLFSLMLVLRGRLRSRRGAERSDWIDVPAEDTTVESFQRMG